MNSNITYDDLYNSAKKLFKNQEELDVISKAYEFANEKHKGKKRLNGDDYITHPLEVANILIGLNSDYITVAAALLHETVNHTDTDIQEIYDNFGDEIGGIVKSISKINRLELKDDQDASAVYLRKILVGLS